jgi:PTS system nitrogen regulatory IIA component
MKLTVRDVALLLQVSEKSVYRWTKDADFPSHRVNGQYRFNRAEVLEWATAHRVQVSPEVLSEPDSHGAPLPSLVQALEDGGIHYRVEGHDKASTLQAVVRALHLPDEVDRDYLFRVLLAREALGSTGVGKGIAIPHVRNPIVLHVPRASITLCFLDKPIEFDAIDGQPVHTLFALISPTVRAHLHMLSRLAFALGDPKFHGVISAQGSRDAIMTAAKDVESTIRPERRQP